MTLIIGPRSGLVQAFYKSCAAGAALVYADAYKPDENSYTSVWLFDFPGVETVAVKGSKICYVAPARKRNVAEALYRVAEGGFIWFLQPDCLLGETEIFEPASLVPDLADIFLEVEKKAPGYWQTQPFPLQEKFSKKNITIARIDDFVQAITKNAGFSQTPIAAGHLISLQNLLGQFPGIRVSTSETNDALANTIQELLNVHLQTGTRSNHTIELPFENKWLQDAVIKYVDAEKNDLPGFTDFVSKHSMEEKQAAGIKYFTGGKGPETILIINALGLTIDFWQSSARLLMQYAQVILWETRCCEIGEGGMKAVISIDEHVADMAAILQAEGEKKYHLLSWCNGARIATAMAAAFPSLIGSIIYLGPAFRGMEGIMTADTKFEKDLDEVFEAAKKNNSMAGFLSAYLVKTNKAAPAHDPALVPGYTDSRFREAVVAPMSTGPYLLNYARRTFNDEHYPVRELIPRISQRVLFILGSEDAVVSNRFIQELIPLFANSSAILVRGASHYIQLQQPRLFAQIVKEFLSGGKISTFNARIENIMRPIKKVPKWVSPLKPGIPVEEGILLNKLYDYPVMHWPGKLAVKDGQGSYTFRELFDRSLALSAFLLEKGIKKGDRIIVIAEKYAEMAILAPAIWKSGAVYVPIDPANPLARNEYLLQSIQPAMVMVPAGNARYALPPLDCELVYYAEIRDSLSVPPPDSINFPDLDSSDLAYIMHTSGSTGEPKGVMIEHGSVMDYFLNHNLVLQFTENSYCLSNAPFYFDVSIEDSFLPLSVGASVYQYRGLTVGSLVLNLMAKEGITHLIAVSTVLALITGDGRKMAQTDLSKLEMVMTGAEVCDIKVINAWKTIAPHVRVLNVYGPTETTIVCTAYTVDTPDDSRTEFYPIGKPLQNVEVLLLDENGLAINGRHKTGTLFIGGSQVMRGYWNDEALTGKVIITHNNIRYYNTGDLCYLDENDDLVFCGRNDDEIKLLGRRINLLEIKRKLLRFPGIKTSAIGVISVETKRSLAAVLAMHAIPALVDVQAIRDELKTQLPFYMQPEYVALVDAPSLARTGKNDEKKMLQQLENEITPRMGDVYVLDEQNRFVPLTH